MALEMRTKCERCETLFDEKGDAYICTYECTFCEGCTNEMCSVRRNCGGELVRRPNRKG